MSRRRAAALLVLILVKLTLIAAFLGGSPAHFIYAGY